MAYRIQGVIRLDDSGNANLGIATATEFDGKVSAKAITEQTDGGVGDVTGADELLLYDTDTGDLLRVTVDEFIGGAGIGTIVTDFTNLNITGIATIGNYADISQINSDSFVLLNSAGTQPRLQATTAGDAILFSGGLAKLQTQPWGTQINGFSLITSGANIGGILTTGNIQYFSDMDISVGSGDSISIKSQTYLGQDFNTDPSATVHTLNTLYPQSGIVLGEVDGFNPDNLNFRTVSGNSVGEIQLNEGLQTFRITSKPDFNFADILVNIDGDTDTITVGCSIIPDTNVTYDLGSPTNRFRDIYLDGNTIYMGDEQLSISGSKLQFNNEEVVTGVGGTINTDYADISSVNAGVITATQVGAANSGTLLLDGNYVPTHNKVFDLGAPLKSWKKVYINNGPKAIEFGNTNIGLGFTVNAQGDNILEFDGHELFAGDGDIGHHGNLNNIYATGIVSATVGAQVGVLTASTIDAPGAELLVKTNLVPSADNTYELGSATNRWKDIYLDGGESVLNIGSVSIGATDGHLTVDGNEVAEYDGSGDIGVLGNLRNINLTGIITGYNAGIVTYYGDGNNLDLPVTSGGGGAIATKYKSSSNTTMSDPGNGKWRLNNLTQSTATQMAVDVKTSGGYNINALLSAITAGTKIFLQRKDRPEAYFTFVVNTAPTLQGTTTDGWYLFSSITNLRNGGTGIADNKDCVLAFKAPNQVDGEEITPSKVALGSAGPSWTNGTGSPEGVITAPVGSLYSRTDGGTGTSLYVKESGTGNTGWVAK